MAFRKIVCPIDFSAGSNHAMQVAARLARDDGAELALVHAWYLPPLAYTGECPLAPDVVQAMSDDAERALAAAVRGARELGVASVSSKLVTGLPWSSIVEVVEQDAAIDLVAIGTHGRTGLARVLLGSVAEKVVRHAPCSVLAIRPGTAIAPFSHVLCPTDFSELSREVVELAVQLPRPAGAGVTLLHVVDPPPIYNEEPGAPDLVTGLVQRSVGRLDAIASELRPGMREPLETRTRIGFAGAQILAELAERSYDLVVMGSHGRSGLQRIFGSVAEKVVRHAPCPVLVARRR